MSACAKCSGEGRVEIAVLDRIGRDTGDSREAGCHECEGSGRSECPCCGLPSREEDDWCSGACKREDRAAHEEDQADARREERLIGGR